MHDKKNFTLFSVFLGREFLIDFAGRGIFRTNLISQGPSYMKRSHRIFGALRTITLNEIFFGGTSTN